MNYKDSYMHLKNPKILSILVGYDKFGKYFFKDYHDVVDVSMPATNQYAIQDIARRYGTDLSDCAIRYGSLTGYMEALLAHCIKTKHCSELLAYLFGKSYMTQDFKSHGEDAMKDAYDKFRTLILGAVNGILWTEDCHLTCVEGGYFVTDNTHVKPDTPAIKVVDREYVRKTAEEAVSDLEHGRGDNALTLARTLMEEVYCKMIELKGEAPNKSGSISVLFGQVRKLYFDGVGSDTAEGKELEKLFNGYNQIQLAVADLRNTGSTSHGAGSERVNLDDHYVRLYVNSSLTLSEFMLDVLECSHIE